MVVPVALRPAAPRAAPQPFRFLAPIVSALHGPGLSQRDKRYLWQQMFRVAIAVAAD